MQAETIDLNNDESRDSLLAMRQRSQGTDTWYCYRNEDLGHGDCGRLTFLVTGPTRTFAVPPPQAPDSPDIGFGWRYRLVGPVDLEAGAVRKGGVG